MRLVSLAAALTAAGCAGDARHARVELDVRTEPCAGDASECTVHLVGFGLIFTAGSETGDAEAGSDALYAEIETSSGALALIEILEDERGERTIHYREVADGEVTLKTRISNARVKAPPVGQWTFEFAAYDEQDGEQGDLARVIENGRVIPLDGDVSAVEVPAQRTTGRPSDDDPNETDTHVVIVIDEGGCGGTDDDPEIPQPEDPRQPRRRPEPEPRREPEHDSGGCDDASSSGCDDTGSSGCDADTGSSSGCEGDSSGGGCDDSSSSGCEGDTASSAGDCDSCEGDISLNGQRRPILSMLRLGWPVWLAGWWNRRKRRDRDRLQRRLLGEGPIAGRDDAR
jgi:hypothetical protein